CSILVAVQRRYGEVEGSTLVNSALRPDPAPVAPHHARNDRQSDALSLVLVRAVQALERLEELRREARIEADALVANEVHNLGRLRLTADLDLRRLTGLRELARVRAQVREDETYHRLVREGARQRADLDVAQTRRPDDLGLFDDLTHDALDVELTPAGLRAPAARVGEEGVHHPDGRRGTLHDPLQIVLLG